MYDLKIVGGTLVDGTGKDRYPGDLGIKDGKIVAVGKCDESAAETLDADGAIAVLEQMLGAAGGRPMSVSTMQRDHSPEQWKWILDRASKANEQGFDVRCQVGARGIGVMLGLQATFHPFMGFPSYKAISQLPLAERVKAMRNPELKARMIQEKSEPVAGDGSMLPPLADFFLSNLEMVAMRLFRLGEKPNYEPSPTESFGAAAMSRGEPVLSLIYDAMLEQDGEALLYFPVYNYTGEDRVRELVLPRQRTEPAIGLEHMIDRAQHRIFVGSRLELHRHVVEGTLHLIRSGDRVFEHP
ncbi:unnamed protein product [marine sediment metagenome]|uniref:Amidohydrolase 3 domain-containing protein n=1 Tax=marine sediment metagenome TaxID=412755 RepID=X0Z5M5_9ZZZZ